jgi:hypothetical protein
VISLGTTRLPRKINAECNVGNIRLGQQDSVTPEERREISNMAQTRAQN